MKTKKVIKEKKYIDKNFYYRLAIYVVLMLILSYILGYSITSFSMVAGIDLVNLPTDICDESS